MKKLYEIFKFQVTKAEDDKSIISGVFSTENEDRHGDIVKQKWDLKHFKNNPVILNNHNYYDATEVIGKATSISVKDNKLQGKIEFAVSENPKAKIIFDLYKGGFLNAFSVGFIPKEWSDKNEILKSELLEISAVSVPANAMALAKAKGIDVNKLYEIPTNGKDNKTKKINEKKSAKKSKSSKSTGGKSGKNNADSGKKLKKRKLKKVEKKVDVKVEVKENKKVKILNKMACIIDEICKSELGRNSDKSEKSDVNRQVNRAIRSLLKLKE